jgi:hypothetical protein
MQGWGGENISAELGDRELGAARFVFEAFDASTLRVQADETLAI